MDNKKAHNKCVSVHDRVSGKIFKVETKSKESVIPATMMDQKRHQTTPLVGPSGRTIKTFGIEKKVLHFGNNRIYTLWFWLSNVDFPCTVLQQGDKSSISKMSF